MLKFPQSVSHIPLTDTLSPSALSSPILSPLLHSSPLLSCAPLPQSLPSCHLLLYTPSSSPPLYLKHRIHVPLPLPQLHQHRITSDVISYNKHIQAVYLCLWFPAQISAEARPSGPLLPPDSPHQTRAANHNITQREEDGGRVE